MKLIGIILFFISVLFEVHLGRTVGEDQIITTQKILNDQLKNDIFDVTTLYKLEKQDFVDVEVHSRTNARYIPFNINNTIKGPNNNVDPLDCSFRKTEKIAKCNWSITSWSTDRHNSPLHPKYTYESISGKSLFLKPLDGNTPGIVTLKIGMDVSDLEQYVQIYNKDDSDNADSTYTYSMSYKRFPVIVMTRNKGNYYYDRYGRYTNGFDLRLKMCQNLYTGYSQSNCQTIHSIDIRNETHYARLEINLNDEKITIQEEDGLGNTISRKENSFRSVMSYNNNHFSSKDGLLLNYVDAINYKGYAYVNHITAQVAYINKSRPNFIEKDWFMPVNNKICFSIVNKVINTKLVVSAIYNDDQRVHLTNITSEQTSKWNIATVVFPLSSLVDLKKYEIKLRIEALLDKSSDAEAFIDQIYACDPDGFEDVYTLQSLRTTDVDYSAEIGPNSSPIVPIHRITYHEYRSFNISISVKDNLLEKGDITCKNGGVRHNNKCACPPGFKGLSCEQGCGANSYGLDCGGMCAGYPNDDGCKGIALCTPYTGCECAPGFFGDSCTSKCERGNYGNGCKQKCGNCKFGSCNRFTGYCKEECENGYVFPSCKELYKYISVKPEAVNISYSEAAIRIPFGSVSGAGNPLFYKILYRVVDSKKPWTSHPQKRIPLAHKTVIVNLKSLSAGVKYNVKVHLIHNNGKYVDDVPVLTIQTKCDALHPWDYNLNVTETTQDSFVAQWTESNSSSRVCKLKEYEVYIQDGWKWTNIGNVTEPRFHYHNESVKLTPGYSYNIRIRPLTYYAALTFSNIVTLNIPSNNISDTFRKDKCEIEIMSIVPTSRNISVTWNRCSWSQHSWSLHYYIYYKLENYLSCIPEEYNNESSLLSLPPSVKDIHNPRTYEVIEISVLDSTSKIITGLKPNTNYSIAVTNIPPRVGITESNAHLNYAATLEDVPEISPPLVKSETSITNDSAIFVINSKNEKDQCTLLNGNILSFYVQLFKNDKTLEFETNDPKLVFEELESNTTYHLEVFYTNSAGRNMSAGQKIDFTTKKSYPIQVSSLAIYKRSNRMLGIRWISDENEEGKKFLIKYSHNGVQVTNVSEGTRCAAWPEMYCFTVDNLTPRTHYTLQVSVANEDYPDGGIPASVTNETSEGLPEEPVSLEIVNMTSSQMSIRWRNPNIFNGILRSFVIRVEEIEAVDISLCCNTFPSIEYPVLKEEIFYNTTVKNLIPGSTYKVGVAAKTTWFGRDKSITVTLPNDNNHIIRDL